MGSQAQRFIRDAVALHGSSGGLTIWNQDDGPTRTLLARSVRIESVSHVTLTKAPAAAGSDTAQTSRGSSAPAELESSSTQSWRWHKAAPRAPLWQEELTGQTNSLVAAAPSCLPQLLPQRNSAPRSLLSSFGWFRVAISAPWPSPKLFLPTSPQGSTPAAISTGTAWLHPNSSRWIQTPQRSELWAAAITEEGWGNPEELLRVPSPCPASPKVKCSLLCPSVAAELQNCLWFLSVTEELPKLERATRESTCHRAHCSSRSDSAQHCGWTSAGVKYLWLVLSRGSSYSSHPDLTLLRNLNSTRLRAR